MISATKRPLPDSTQQSQETDRHVPGGIRIRNRSKRAAADIGTSVNMPAENFCRRHTEPSVNETTETFCGCATWSTSVAVSTENLCWYHTQHISQHANQKLCVCVTQNTSVRHLKPRTIYMAAKPRVVRFNCKQIAGRFTFTHTTEFSYSE